MSVLVYLENWEGKFKKATYELLTYARETAELLNTSLVGLSIGNVADDELKTLGTYGLSKVLSNNNSELSQFKAQNYTDALAAAVDASGADVIIVGNTYNGKAMAPRLAAKIDAAVASAVIALPNVDNGFAVKRTVFSNKGFAMVELNAPKKILSLNINAHHVSEANTDISIEDISGSVEVKGKPIDILEVKKQTGKIPLTEAELVVSAGRGLKGPENWGMVEELADLIGAATACSKPVSDVGWRSHSEHVGQTGITIGPNLYIAIGISGAIQHLAGVSSSKVICVINKDPEAPFFNAADYGIVGDAFEVVPKLIAAVKALN